MAAYLVANYTITDMDFWQTNHAANVIPTILSHGGEILVAEPETEAVEGSPRVVSLFVVGAVLGAVAWGGVGAAVGAGVGVVVAVLPRQMNRIRQERSKLQVFNHPIPRIIAFLVVGAILGWVFAGWVGIPVGVGLGLVVLLSFEVRRHRREEAGV